MSLKKYDLAKNLGLKIEGRMKAGGPPQRFAEGSAVPDKREQRRLDAQAGLVAFACKLPAPLVERLRERAAAHEGGLNGLVAELLEASLKNE